MYIVMKRNIIFSLVVFFFCLTANAQIKVRGTIVDDKNEPLIGVNIQEEGTTNGSISDVNGQYSITVAGIDSKLSFSFISYKTIVEKVGNRTVINVTLVEDSELLQEVVVVGYGVQKKSGQNFFPNITIESLNVFDVLNLCKKQDYDGLTDYLLNGINQLSAAGVQYAALTGITTHIVFDALSKVSPVPLVSMVDTASEFAKAHRYRKVCLLGTLPTMNGTFFQQSFESKGIEVITPDAAEKEYIGRKIETELELGKVVSDTQNNFRTIAERIIQDENVDTIILGCTELPLIFKGIDLSVPCLNVMQVHIDSLIDLIMSE